MSAETAGDSTDHASSTASSAASSTQNVATDDPKRADGADFSGPPGSGFKTFGHYLNELSTWAAYWLAAKRDQAKLTARKIAIYAGLGVLGLVCTATALIVAVVMLLTSLGGWLGHGFSLITPGLYFLGPLLIALFVLGGAVLGIRIGVQKMLGISQKQTEMKYERKRIGQRAKFGFDVRDRSAQQRRRAK